MDGSKAQGSKVSIGSGGREERPGQGKTSSSPFLIVFLINRFILVEAEMVLWINNRFGFVLCVKEYFKYKIAILIIFLCHECTIFASKTKEQYVKPEELPQVEQYVPNDKEFR